MTLGGPCVQSSPPTPYVVDSLTGIVPSVFEVEMDRHDPDIFVAAANASSVHFSGSVSAPDAEGSGAGLTWQAAWSAAVGEAVERYALSNVYPEDILFGSSAVMQQLGHDPVNPRDWVLFHHSQHNSIPFVHFGEDTPIAWVAAQSITHRRNRLVPACLTYIPYHPLFMDQGEKLVAAAVSTGAACAGSHAEALLNGVCEQIERDAFMIVWRNRLTCPRIRIDPESSLHSIFRERFQRPGLDYSLVYTTLDLAIPSVFGILIDSRTEPPGIVVGGAAHPDPARAVLKTLLELVQGLKWKDYEALRDRSSNQVKDFREVRSFKDRARLYAFRDLRAAFGFVFDHPREVPFSRIPSLDLGEPGRNLDLCVRLLAERGLETVAIDLTPEDVQAGGLYVTRVLVPGCEVMEGDHLLPHLGGLRWRSVPHDLGLMPCRPDVNTRNPFPHPYP